MTRSAECGDVPAREVDGGATPEVFPRERAVLAGGPELFAEQRDRPVAVLVDVRERAPLPPGRVTRVHGDAAGLELLARAATELVVGERGKEETRACEVGQLDGRDSATSRRLFPRLERLHDLTGSRHALDARELHPFDMTDYGEVHFSHLEPQLRFIEMVSGVPPFERFYDSHKSEVLAFLRRRAGRDRADDLFQETFLRALRAYGGLEHGEHLRAWVLTIASNAVVDAARRERPTAELSVEPAGEDERPAVEELAPLTDGLPPKERAAVVLRYGYDLDYDTIAAALGSNEQAARQAASAGVRRLRKEKKQS